jgi:hypothetical protein
MGRVPVALGSTPLRSGHTLKLKQASSLEFFALKQ